MSRGSEIPFRVACPHCGNRVACTRHGLHVQNRIRCRCNKSFYCDPATRQVHLHPLPTESFEVD